VLTDQLRADLTAAMKARDETRTAALRMALAAVQAAAVAGKEAKEMGDDETLRILGREVKKREEAAEAFKTAGRDDRASKELAERDVLATYLPQPLSDDGLVTLIEQVLAEGGWSGAGAMGPAMKAVTAAVAGRADGKKVAGLVKERLGS